MWAEHHTLENTCRPWRSFGSLLGDNEGSEQWLPLLQQTVAFLCLVRSTTEGVWHSFGMLFIMKKSRVCCENLSDFEHSV